MRKRLGSSVINASTTVFNQQVANLRNKTASTRKKERSKCSCSSVSIAFGSLLVLLIGLLSSYINSSKVVLTVKSEEEKVAVFMDWFRAAGGNVSTKIAIETFPRMGRGIVALQTVEEEDELLFVPKNVIICFDTIKQEWSSQPKLKKALTHMENEQEELLTAFLLLEQAKGLASRWAPYLQLLPSFSSRKEVGSPLLFTSNEDVESLQDERMIKATRTERALAKKAYNRFLHLFQSIVDGKTLELSRYTWTRFLVNSRAFSIQGQRLLVPFGDIFNGKSDIETREYDNGQRFLQFHRLQSAGMTIRADRNTLRGDQLFEDYGDNSNYVYFLHHGFLMDENGFDCVAFRLPSLVDSHTKEENEKKNRQLVATKSKILTRVKVEDAPLACISRTGKLENSGLVRIYAAVYRMDAGQAAVCDNAKAFSECFSSELLSNLDEKSHQEEYLNFILPAIRQQLENYPTTIEADLQISNKHEKTTLIHAVIFRLSRKQILLDAQLILEQQIQHFEKERGKFDNKKLLKYEKEEQVDNKLKQFQQWITLHDFPINYLELRYINEAVGYGTFALKSLAKGDIYLSVPVQVVMNLHSALQSPWVKKVINGLEKERANVIRDEMLLLLHILEEKFGPKHEQSYWKPYLDMLPNVDTNEGSNTLSSPLFYEENGEQLTSLKGSDLLSLVMNYRQRVAQSFVLLSDYLKKTNSDESLIWLNERRFLWANAMLDSRSIWWNSERHLVPLLDMVNCQELDSNHKPHTTKLNFSGRHAVTKASWTFKAGEQIVENYAQPNYIYLLYHGFVLNDNSHDCVHFHLKLPVAARKRKFALLLQKFQIYSMTPDLCVNPKDERAISKLTQIALFISDAEEALQHAKEDAKPSTRAISSALEIVNERLRSLNRFQLSAADISTRQDFRTQNIDRYRLQQLRLLQHLHKILVAKLS